jgi:hydroxymethylbilane synthase
MSVPTRHFRIGTRGSPMALHQTALVGDRLVAAAANGAVEIVTIRTTGDRPQDRLFAELGGKGRFVKEIEEALIARHIDLALQCSKDFRDWAPRPAGDRVCASAARRPPRHVVVDEGGEPRGLARGCEGRDGFVAAPGPIIATRPDLKILPIRRNVNTRIRKLHSGEIDALVLALCGLQRLGKADLAIEILSREVPLPAVGQGALALEGRAADEALRQPLEPFDDPRSAACVDAERAMPTAHLHGRNPCNSLLLCVFWHPNGGLNSIIHELLQI